MKKWLKKQLKKHHLSPLPKTTVDEKPKTTVEEKPQNTESVAQQPQATEETVTMLTAQ